MTFFRCLLVLAIATVSIGTSSSSERSTTRSPVGGAAALTPVDFGLVEAAHGASISAGEVATRIARAAVEATLVPPLDLPALDRWDAVLIEASDGDPELAALLKAFVAVESMGQQFAVSRSGCAGLMQFCAGTATEPRFDEFFRSSTIRTCDCPDGGCKVGADVRGALESGDRRAVRLAEHAFPCDADDDRFDPARSLGAGRVYLENLRARYSGNLELTYIAYNSGPGVADKILERLAEDEAASPRQVIRAVRRHPEWEVRMKSLAEVALPNIRDAYNRYRYVQPL